jgi:predicted permease
MRARVDRRRHERRQTTPIGHGPRTRLFGGLMQDVKYALRSLRSTPTFTIVALVVLSLGIGATTAIFSVVDGVALKGLPFPASGRLVLVSEPRPANRGSGAVPVADLVDWQAQQRSFSDLAGFQGSGGFVLHDPSGASESLRVGQVTANLFTMLRVPPALGRSFTADDALRDDGHVAVLSDAFWRRHFGADPATVGKILTSETGTWSIIGVMPQGFTYPLPSTRSMDLWTLYIPPRAELTRAPNRHTSSNLQVVGRLKDGTSLETARLDIEAITNRAKAQFPAWFVDRGVAVQSLQDAVVGPAKSWMLLLLASVTFVLLIACVNVANLQIARAAARSRDVAVRAALGASRWRIVRGLFTESLLLSAAGTALGVAFAVWGVHVLRTSLPANLPRLNEVAVNYRVLFVAACTSIAVAVGVTPIWQSPTRVGASLRKSGRSGGVGDSRGRLRTGLLIAEVALAVVLLVGSGLFITSFVALMRVDLGFDIDHVLSVDLSPSTRIRGTDLTPIAGSITAAFDAVRRLPGVQSSALVSGTPPLLGGVDRSSVTVPGKPPFNDPDDSPDDKSITPAYFNVLGVPLVAGRFFSDDDLADGAEPVVILNDTAAARYFGQENPIGATIGVSGGDVPGFTVVGVVRAIRLQGPETEARPEIYLPLNWHHGRGSPLMTLLLRTVARPEAFAQTARVAVKTASPALAVPDPIPYADLFGRLVAQRKFNMVVLALFGLLAITIAAAGIYGVMAHLVEQRTQEIGVRLALGAEPARVLRMVLSRAAWCLTIGMAIGLAGGWMLSQSVRAFLFRIDAHDVRVYIAAAALLMAAGLAAALIPARRAARVDPVIALRAQ